MNKKKLKIISVLITAVIVIAGVALSDIPLVFGAPTQKERYERNLFPELTNTYDLGTTTLVWRNGNFENITVTGTCTGCGGVGGSSLHIDGGSFVYPHQGNSHSAPFYSATSTTATSTFSGFVVTTIDPMIDVRAYGAKGDGVTDDTSEIQAAVDAVPSSGGTVLIPRGNFKITSAINITTASTTITGLGGGSKITFTTGTGAAIYAEQTKNITVKDLTLDLQSQGNNGIVYAAVDTGSITNVRILNPIGYGIWLLRYLDVGATEGTLTKNITVANNHVSGVTDTGIEVYGGAGNTIVGNTVTGTAGQGIYFWNGAYNNTAVANHVEGENTSNLFSCFLIANVDAAFPTVTHHNSFVGNSSKDCFIHYSLKGQSAATTTVAHNTLVEGNVMEGWNNGGSDVGVFMASTTQDTIRNNKIYQVYSPLAMSDIGAGWTPNTVTFETIEGNTIFGGTTSLLYGNRGGSLSGNTWTNTLTHSVRLYGWVDNQISDNRFTNIGVTTNSVGLILQTSTVNESSGNIFSRNIATDNRATKYTNYTILLSDASTNNILRDNVGINTVLGTAVQDGSTGTNTFTSVSGKTTSITPNLSTTYASTTALTATALCLTGDLPCRTTWPAGGSGLGWASTTSPDSNSIYSTALSNVGIGTTSPYAKLSVEGDAVFGGSTGVTAGRFVATSTSATSTLAGGLTIDGTTFVLDHSLNKIGIGTTTIGQINGVQFGSVKVHISGSNTYSAFDTIGNGGILFNDSSEAANSRLWSFNTILSGGTLSFATLTDAGTATHQLVVTRGGHVGIGTSTPQAKLEVYDDFTSKGALTIYDSDTAKAQDESFGSILWKNSEASAPGQSIGYAKIDVISNSNGTAANMAFQTADFNDGALRTVMTIAGGINGVSTTDNVGIGSTTPYSKLSINTDLSASGSSALYVQPSIAVGVQQASMTGSLFTANHVNNIGGDDVIDFKTVEIIPSIRTTTGAITNLYGLYVNDSTAGGTQNISAYFANKVGIGTTTPYAKLSVVGETVAQNFTATSTTATSSFWGGFEANNDRIFSDWNTGSTTISQLLVGNQSFDVDAGFVNWTDLPLSTAAINTPQGYSALLAGSTTISVYGISNGGGGTYQAHVGIGTSSPASRLTVWGVDTATSSPLLSLVNNASTTFYRMMNNGDQFAKVGATANHGTSTLAAGTVTVTSSKIAADSLVQLTNCVAGGTVGVLSVGTRTAGISFVINSSSGTDTSTVCWEIKQPIY